MSLPDKVEVMDLLINVLKDHEKSLDTLLGRAEDILLENQNPINGAHESPSLKVHLRDWDEFKNKSVEAEMVCFEMIDSRFCLHMLTENKIYVYEEETPAVTLEKLGSEDNVVVSGVRFSELQENIHLFNGRLNIGLELVAKRIKHEDGKEKHRLFYDLDILYTKNWLSQELQVSRDFIMHGSIEN